MSYTGRQLALTLYSLIKQSNNQKQVNTIIDQFAKFCISHRLQYLKKDIIKHLRIINNNDQIKNNLNIFSSFTLNPSEINKIKKIITKDINLNIITKLDQNIIGGFKAEYNNKIWEATINNNLNKLKYNLINS